MSEKKRFEGSDNYVATDDLRVAVNAATLSLAMVFMSVGSPPTPWAAAKPDTL